MGPIVYGQWSWNLTRPAESPKINPKLGRVL